MGAISRKRNLPTKRSPLSPWGPRSLSSCFWPSFRFISHVLKFHQKIRGGPFGREQRFVEIELRIAILYKNHLYMGENNFLSKLRWELLNTAKSLANYGLCIHSFKIVLGWITHDNFLPSITLTPSPAWQPASENFWTLLQTRCKMRQRPNYSSCRLYVYTCVQ